MAEKYKRTEYLLYNYKAIEAKIKNLDIDIKMLQEDYTGVTGISYEESTGGTNKFNSSVENEVISREEQEEQIVARLKAEMDYHVRTKQKVDNALDILSPEERELIRLRYFENPKKMWVYISQDLSMDKDYCRKLNTSVINKLSELIFSY